MWNQYSLYGRMFKEIFLPLCCKSVHRLHYYTHSSAEIHGIVLPVCWCAIVVFSLRYVTSSLIGWDGSHLAWGNRWIMEQSWKLPSSGGNTKMVDLSKRYLHVISRSDVCWNWTTHKLTTPCCDCYVSGVFIVNSSFKVGKKATSHHLNQCWPD